MLEPHFVWDAVQLSKWNGHTFEMFVDEPWTAQAFWDLQVCLRTLSTDHTTYYETTYHRQCSQRELRSSTLLYTLTKHVSLHSAPLKDILSSCAAVTFRSTYEMEMELVVDVSLGGYQWFVSSTAVQSILL